MLKYIRIFPVKIAHVIYTFHVITLSRKIVWWHILKTDTAAYCGSSMSCTHWPCHHACSTGTTYRAYLKRRIRQAPLINELRFVIFLRRAKNWESSRETWSRKCAFTFYVIGDDKWRSRRNVRMTRQVTQQEIHTAATRKSAVDPPPHLRRIPGMRHI